MRQYSVVAIVSALLSVSVLTHAQTRETSVQLESAGEQASQPAEVPKLVDNLGRDATSTSVTGAKAVLGAGDLLEVVVFDTPELTQRVRVNSEGRIILPLIGEITVQGMSADDLGKTITKKLIDGHFVKDPQVSVFVAEYAGQMAYITGEVNKPGAYSLLRSHRLSDIVSVAGGLGPRAGNLVTIARDDGSALEIDLADPDERRRNPEIKPGDSIAVGKTGVIYVLGDVERPGGFLMDRRTKLSVIQAIALAEGAKPSASLAKAKLIRTSDQTREEIPINLQAMLKSQTPDLTLQAGDIIYVPGSVFHGIGRVSMQTIMATASGLAIYRPY